jgi:hypothetical protein
VADTDQTRLTHEVPLWLTPCRRFSSIVEKLENREKMSSWLAEGQRSDISTSGRHEKAQEPRTGPRPDEPYMTRLTTMAAMPASKARGIFKGGNGFGRLAMPHNIEFAEALR